MNKHVIIGGALALFAIVVPLAALNAQAQGVTQQPRYSQESVKQALRFVKQLEVQGQRLMSKALLLALEIETPQSRVHFEVATVYFDHVLQTLRNGDPELGIPMPESPELSEPLLALWQV